MKSSQFCEVARSQLCNSQPGVPGKASWFCDVTYLIWLALTEYLLCAQCWVNIDRILPWLNDLLSSVTWRWTTDLLNVVAITTFDFCNTGYRQKNKKKQTHPNHYILSTYNTYYLIKSCIISMSYYYFPSSRWGHSDPKEMTNFPKYLQAVRTWASWQPH